MCRFSSLNLFLQLMLQVCWVLKCPQWSDPCCPRLWRRLTWGRSTPCWAAWRTSSPWWPPPSSPSSTTVPWTRSLVLSTLQSRASCSPTSSYSPSSASSGGSTTKADILSLWQNFDSVMISTYNNIYCDIYSIINPFTWNKSKTVERLIVLIVKIVSKYSLEYKNILVKELWGGGELSCCNGAISTQYTSTGQCTVQTGSNLFVNTQ